MSTWLEYEEHSYGYCKDNHLFDYTFMNSNPLTKFNAPLHKREEYLTLPESEQFLSNVPKDQASPYPDYNTLKSNTLNQQQQQQQQQQQYQNQSQLGANRSVYGQSYNQGQNYQLGNQYNNFGYQPLSQQGF